MMKQAVIRATSEGWWLGMQALITSLHIVGWRAGHMTRAVIWDPAVSVVSRQNPPLDADSATYTGRILASEYSLQAC